MQNWLVFVYWENFEHLNVVCSKVVHMITNDVSVMTGVNNGFSENVIGNNYILLDPRHYTKQYERVYVYIYSYLFNLYVFSVHDPLE